MYQAWLQHPGYFVLESLVVLAVLFLTGYVFLKNRDFRHKERLQFLQNPRPDSELFFSGKLLNYIPWQFWTSLGILILIIICYFVTGRVSNDTRAAGTFLDLIKTVIGAVIGSFFGKSVKRSSTQASSPERRAGL